MTSDFAIILWYHMTPKAQVTKVKVDQLAYIKIKNRASKNTVNRLERQWEKISAHIISNKN